MTRSIPALALGLAVALTACESDSAGPDLDRNEVAGTYDLTTLAFDPQGSLPEVEVDSLFGGLLEPRILLTASGDVQLFYTDPVTGLGRTVDGTYRTTSTGARITFDASGNFPDLFLSETTQFTFNANARTLSFTGDAGTAVARDRLVALVPELEEEQLLDPVPGTLRVVFTAPAEE